ncbi:hypothetical protein SAMN04488118_1153 [Epibacterium ulvae]|uniref:Uncharacterized protein n=1 Tax=Epibacterium ulvae TaxID=1156985 RepID=A0A1G5RFS3_9RHOB|nr:hypothetical protein SAMN04488118_1153 [Epibacterium ulvae]
MLNWLAIGFGAKIKTLGDPGFGHVEIAPGAFKPVRVVVLHIERAGGHLDPFKAGMRLGGKEIKTRNRRA